MRIARVLAATTVAATVLLTGGTSHADHNDCHNEPGDVYVGVVGVDSPGSNGYVFGCVGNGTYGVHRDGTCVEIIVNHEELGGC